ncbi:MAG: amidohydrolase [Proteobacteria bacterium]|nr:amidohydrolase [Pseudomonadota bacterium]MBU1420671.1 amidohydrolase [Pseudomonadota bacterium]MBU1454323.1 amidohydrolase [Pseudomonadota bacterium]
MVGSELFAWMRTIRQHLHQNPELAFQEFKTAAYVCEKLSELGIRSQPGMAGTGVLAEIGTAKNDRIVGLRADMDALPIKEKTGLPFASEIAGCMHACGHDGHMAMLLGAAALLGKMDLPGRVRFIFQPAEENGNGAEKMIEEGVADGLDAIFAGHIDTHYPTGSITVDEGIICAYADPFIIRLRGSSGHAARPHEAKDSIVAAAGLITALQSLVSREVDPNHAAVVTIGHVQAGETHNVIAEEAILEGTIRSTHPEARSRLLAGLERMVMGSSSLYAVTADLEFPDFLPAVINSASAAKVARKAAVAVTPEKSVFSQGPSSLGGEDFSFYLQKVNGCLVRFGAHVSADTGPAHSSTFDFDEAVLSTGAAWYARVAMEFLQESVSA